MKTIEEIVGKSVRVSGKWWDVLRYKDGRVVDGPHGNIEWPSNQIQDSFANMLAALVIGDAVYGLPISYMGIGHGDAGWDVTPPTLDPTETTLFDEYFRKVINPADMYFIDPITGITTGGVPSPKVEINLTLLEAEAIGAMREFGLFGGTATIALDSGEMVNWVYHPRIDKDASLEIQRRVRLTFQTA